MSRALKPLKVDTVYDTERRARVDVFLDRNDKTFFAEVQLEKVKAPTAEAVIKLVREKLKEWQPPEWKAVIQLEVSSPHHFGHGGRIEPQAAGLSFSFERKEIAQAMNGNWIERPFTADVTNKWEIERRAEDPLHEVQSCRDDELEQQIPYSEAAWATLTGLVAATIKAREKLEELFDPKDGGKKLLAMTGVLLLPSDTTPEAVPHPRSFLSAKKRGAR